MILQLKTQQKLLKFILPIEGNAITLTRGNGGEWKVNDKYLARRSNILNLLEVIYKVDVRTKVAKSAYNNVIKRIASNGIKCEIYLNGKDKAEKNLLRWWTNRRYFRNFYDH